jgi:hypothetical protein
VEPVSPPRPRWVRGLVVAFVAFELAAAAVLVARNVADDETTSGGPGTPSATGQRLDSAARDTALRVSAVDRLLERRARAIRTRDRAGFVATLDASRPAFVTRQLAMFDALERVPIELWWYEVDAGDTAPPPDGYAGEAWAPKVTLKYSLRGFDAEPAEAPQYFTFVSSAAGWLVAADDDFAATGRRTARELWDFGPVVTVPGERALVLGHPGHDTLLRDVARHAAAAVPRVTAVWGTGWAQRVVVLVPATEEELAQILDDGGDLSRVAAVAVAGLRAQQDAVGNRVLVNPPNFRRLGATGRRVVLTHEVTHVASRDHGDGLPTWLVEGFADYVGYLGSGLAPRVVCQELAAEVRAGRIPRDLPTNAEFDGGNPRLAQTYEAAWLAVRLIAERLGRDGTAAFYRAAATTPLDLLLRDRLGVSRARFAADWRAYVKQTLG